MADVIEFFYNWAGAIGFGQRTMTVEYGSPDVVFEMSVGGKRPSRWQTHLNRRDIRAYRCPREMALLLADEAKRALRELVAAAEKP